MVSDGCGRGEGGDTDGDDAAGGKEDGFHG